MALVPKVTEAHGMPMDQSALDLRIRRNPIAVPNRRASKVRQIAQRASSRRDHPRT